MRKEDIKKSEMSLFRLFCMCDWKLYSESGECVYSQSGSTDINSIHIDGVVVSIEIKEEIYKCSSRDIFFENNTIICKNIKME